MSPATIPVADEAVRWIEAGDETVLGVVTRPTTAPRGTGVVFLNGGHGGSSSGKNRIYTRMAAALADLGFHSVRLEWRGIGDSTGAVDEYVMDEPFVEEALGAAQLLRDEGCGRIAVYGECFGARTAVVAAPQLPDLEAMYLVTLVLRDGALSEQNPQRLLDELPAREFVKRLGKLRHIGDARRRRLYVDVARNKARQVVQKARYRREGHRELAPWVGRQVVTGLEHLGARGVPVHLVYGDSYWDPHRYDFEAVAADLAPLRHDTTTWQVLPEMIAGYRTLPVQDHLVALVAEWFDRAVPADG